MLSVVPIIFFILYFTKNQYDVYTADIAWSEGELVQAAIIPDFEDVLP